jgi:hypothetical protein
MRFNILVAKLLIVTLSFSVTSYAAVGAVNITSDGLQFSDGTKQSSATVQGPVGLQGAKGDTGPQGPPAQLTLPAICDAIKAGGMSLPTYCPQAPIANAGADQVVDIGTIVMLDGRYSRDANYDPLTYTWSFTSKPPGSTAVLSSTNVAMPTFIADVAGAYILNLVVNDGTVNSAPAMVAVTANMTPVANAGSGQSVVIGTIVKLDGSASVDANGDLLIYSWSFTSKPSGSSAVLSSANVAKPTFTVDLAGVYILNLVVNDGKVNSAAASVTITTPGFEAPSTPAGLTITQVTSNSVSISWNPSTGGSGGVYAYKIYRDGTILKDGTQIWVPTIDKTATTFTDIGSSYYSLLKQSTSYTYTVASSSYAGTDSDKSNPVTATTLPLADLLNKLSPYIFFNTSTGMILKQFYISPKMISTYYSTTGYDFIPHQRVDSALYRVTSLGNRKYTLTSISTGLPIGIPIDAPTNSSSGGGEMFTIDMNSGELGQYGSANFLNTPDGKGAFLQGEIL